MLTFVGTRRRLPRGSFEAARPASPWTPPARPCCRARGRSRAAGLGGDAGPRLAAGWPAKATRRSRRLEEAIFRRSRATRAGPGGRSLTPRSARRLARMLSHGTTTVEAEIGLRVDGRRRVGKPCGCSRTSPPLAELPRLVPTLLAAHEIPPEYRERRGDWVRAIVEEILPAAARRRWLRFCDVFCEEGVFTVAESRQILDRRAKPGLGLRIHANELALSGGARLAAELPPPRPTTCSTSGRSEIAALAKGPDRGRPLPGTAWWMRKPPGARPGVDRGRRAGRRRLGLEPRHLLHGIASGRRGAHVPGQRPLRGRGVDGRDFESRGIARPGAGRSVPSRSASSRRRSPRRAGRPAPRLSLGREPRGRRRVARPRRPRVMTDLPNSRSTEFLAALASEAPAPGGGTAAAVCGGHGSGPGSDGRSVDTLQREVRRGPPGCSRDRGGSRGGARRASRARPGGRPGLRPESSRPGACPGDRRREGRPHGCHRGCQPAWPRRSRCARPARAVRLLAALPELVEKGNPSAASDAGAAALLLEGGRRGRALERRDQPAPGSRTRPSSPT